jgi:hypothetical protein
MEEEELTTREREKYARGREGERLDCFHRRKSFGSTFGEFSLGQ